MTRGLLLLSVVCFSVTANAENHTYWQKKALQAFSDEYMGPGPVLHHLNELKKEGLTKRVNRSATLLTAGCNFAGCEYTFLVTDSYISDKSVNATTRSIGGIVTTGLLGPYKVNVLSPDEIDELSGQPSMR